MALRQPRDSTGRLQKDFKEIAIDRLNYVDENAYSDLDDISKRKIDDYTKEQAVAMRAFLERQEMRITNMEAVGLIRPGSIQVTGGLSTPSAPGAPVSLVNPAINVKPIKLLVQISRTSNKVGLPEVIRNVKKTIVRFMETIF